MRVNVRTTIYSCGLVALAVSSLNVGTWAIAEAENCPPGELIACPPRPRCLIKALRSMRRRRFRGIGWERTTRRRRIGFEIARESNARSGPIGSQRSANSPDATGQRPGSRPRCARSTTPPS